MSGAPAPTTSDGGAPGVVDASVGDAPDVDASPVQVPDASDQIELHLNSQVVEFKPTRDEITVGKLWLRIECHKTTNPDDACDAFSVSGPSSDTDGDYAAFLEFNAVGKNKVEIIPHQITFSPADGGYLCIATRTVFNEVSPQEDTEIYVNYGDRYSLLSFCTSGEPPDTMPGNFPFTQNRVDTFDEFLTALTKPIVIQLK